MVDLKSVTQEVGSAVELFNELNKFDLNEWVFRGQANSEWGLTPGIERLLPTRCKWPGQAFFSQMEKMAQDDFKRGVHHFLEHDDLPSTDLAWLSLMQHHGTPTRLLDFTQSPFVSLYFATDGISFSGEGSSAIWAINWSHVFDVNQVLYRSVTGFSLQDDFWGSDDDVYNKAIAFPSSLALVLEPFKKNKRLFVQQGTFALTSNFASPFEDVLFCSEIYGALDGYVRKINFSNSIGFDVVEMLSSMNINSYTIYPGVDGFAGKVKSMMRNRVYKQTA